MEVEKPRQGGIFKGDSCAFAEQSNMHAQVRGEIGDPRNDHQKFNQREAMALTMKR
jgi:hypothetical protein